MATACLFLYACSADDGNTLIPGEWNAVQNSSGMEDNSGGETGADTDEKGGSDVSVLSVEESKPTESEQENPQRNGFGPEGAEQAEQTGSGQEGSKQENPQQNEFGSEGPEQAETNSAVTIGFVGDIYLSDTLYAHYGKADNRVSGFLTNGLADCFTDVDIMVANHEYACTDLPEEEKDIRQAYNFKAPTDREFLWNEMGVDIVSLANNHAMDFGERSLLDTLDILDEQGIEHIGAGRNLDEAKRAAIVERNGKKIAFLAASRIVINADWYAGNDAPGLLTTYENTSRFELVKKEITRLKEEEGCDFVVVYVHFGEEREAEYTEYQEVVAHGYIDAGADLVMGSHAHVLQGIEIYEGKPIYYNLGNFLFSAYQSDTMFVQITVREDNSCATRITPCISKLYRTGICGDDDRARILQYLQELSKNVVIDELGNVTE